MLGVAHAERARLERSNWAGECGSTSREVFRPHQPGKAIDLEILILWQQIQPGQGQIFAVSVAPGSAAETGYVEYTAGRQRRAIPEEPARQSFAAAWGMSDAASPDAGAQALHDEIASVQKDLGAQVHQVKSEVGQMRAEMRQEMAELRKEMREVMACIGQLMEKSAVRRPALPCPTPTVLARWLTPRQQQLARSGRKSRRLAAPDCRRPLFSAPGSACMLHWEAAAPSCMSVMAALQPLNFELCTACPGRCACASVSCCVSCCVSRDGSEHCRAKRAAQSPSRATSFVMRCRLCLPQDPAK
eukprot:COSAG06_NODE_3242_length_5628_cov_1.674806_1_plen_302_part_00